MQYHVVYSADDGGYYAETLDGTWRVTKVYGTEDQARAAARKGLWES